MNLDYLVVIFVICMPNPFTVEIMSFPIFFAGLFADG